MSASFLSSTDTASLDQFVTCRAMSLWHASGTDVERLAKRPSRSYTT
jgi:hypothetical protein